MSVDMDHLRSCGVSSGSYRKIFAQSPRDYPKRIGELTRLISQRITDGRSRNFRDWKTWAAIDIACDIPFRQTTPTMINHILSRNLDLAGTRAALAEWGLREEDLFLKVQVPGKEDLLVPNPPVFFQIFIPICKAYLAIREAKLFNERNTDPLLPYRPLKNTSRNQVLCEIITDAINTISTWYGYSSVLRQAIKQTLKYGIMLAFPEEEWHVEKQVRINPDGKPETYVVKEGIRYILPHPTRMFYDLKRPLTRVNSDTGCEWMGHWFIRSYGDILDNRSFWNRTRIFAGTNWLDSSLSGSYFKEFYPCQMDFPAPTASGPPSREDLASFYQSGSRDQAVFLTDFFIKLKPSDWDLGEYRNGKLVKTYDYPVWHRFLLAGDDTVIWAAPCAYNPCWFMGYDYDENAGRNSSLGLELIPWQDHVGNILSQIILTALQNLANVTFYDTNVIDKADIEALQNKGEVRYRGMVFLPFDSLQRKASMAGIKDALFTAQLSKASIIELLQTLPMVLNIMERVIQISAQEAGSAASHQQSKYELQQTGGASTNRVVFTGSIIDEGTDAWKKQLHDGAMAYMDGSISAEVSSDIKDLPRLLNELGFEVTGTGDDSVLVKGHKRVLRLEGFASTSRAEDPNKDKEIAQVIFQVAGTLGAQPELAKTVGVRNILMLLEQGAKFAGAPRDFRLPVVPEGAPDGQISEAILQAIQQAQAATMQAVEERIAKPAAQAVAQDQQRLQALEGMMKQLQQIYQVAQAEQEKASALAAKVASDAQRKDIVAAKTVARQDAVANAQIQREQAKTAAEIQIAEQKAKSEMAIAGATAAHGATLAEKSATAKAKSKE
jgi:hypothetical protein